METSPEAAGHAFEERTAAVKQRLSRQRWMSVRRAVVAITLLGSIFSACFVPVPPMTAAQCERWLAERPSGTRSLMETASHTANAYHQIADTSIVELQDAAVSKRIGEIVTRARDAWRRTESHGLGWRSYNTPSLLWGADFTPIGYPVHCYAEHESISMHSDRGLLICTVWQNGTVAWTEPFRSIVIGDRIDSIQDLIASIKR